MSNSLNYDANDLSVYNLVVTSSRANILEQLVPFVQLKYKGYGSGIMRSPKNISITIAVTGISRANLDSNLDNIKKLIATETDSKLIFDILSTRYYMARTEKFDGQYISKLSFMGTIDFVCTDPLGYSTTLTNSNHNIDSDPKTVTETTTGTGLIDPVYTLTAGENLTDVTIKLENLTTDEELQWTGSLANGEVLEIDVPNWIVRKEGSASMSTITGQFPRLMPGANSIKVTGFSNTGSLDIDYRNTYL